MCFCVEKQANKNVLKREFRVWKNAFRSCNSIRENDKKKKKVSGESDEENRDKLGLTIYQENETKQNNNSTHKKAHTVAQSE